MNLTKFAILFVIICLPFYLVSELSVRRVQQVQTVKAQYETIISNAVDDAALALRLYSESSFDDDATSSIQVDADEVVNAFLASYHFGFNAKGETDRQIADSHILALIIVAYDGYYIYGTKPARENLLDPVSYQQILSDKHPFVYNEGDISVYFTLDDYIKVVRRSVDPVSGDLWPEVEGLVSDPEVSAAFPTGLNTGNFEDTKNYVITSTIENALSKTVIDHNSYTKNHGMSYQFHLPVSDAGGYGRNLQDLSVLAFIQGKDIGFGETLEFNALSQGSVLVNKEIMGYEQLLPGGGSEFYYCDWRCTHSHENIYTSGLTNNMVKVFTTKEEAAMDGFYPCQLIGK